jgi:hypothetical protein
MGTETDEQIVARLVRYRVYVADGHEKLTYDGNPAIVIEHVEEDFEQIELHSYEAWALVRLLLKALEEYVS